MPGGPLSHFRAVAARRLIFCAIDKNANSAFADLLCSLSRARPAAEEASPLQQLRRWLVTHLRTWADFELGCSWSSTYFEYQGLSVAQLRRAMASHGADASDAASWQSFVFVRDPLERFLSGYISKCQPGHDMDNEVCEQVFGAYPISFARAVAVVNASGTRFADPPGWAANHFRLQSTFCNGSVGRGEFGHTWLLERTTSRRLAGEMLRRVGVHSPSEQVGAYDYHFPPPAEGMRTPAEAAADEASGGSFDHSTHAERQRARYLSDPAHVRVLLEHYAPDYRTIPGLSVPRWVVEKLGTEYVRGLGLPVHVPPHETAIE
jgi:hypothetical protein